MAEEITRRREKRAGWWNSVTAKWLGEEEDFAKKEKKEAGEGAAEQQELWLHGSQGQSMKEEGAAGTLSVTSWEKPAGKGGGMSGRWDTGDDKFRQTR